ncbi:ArsR/SmtB family transcription factor [Paenibacillus alkalitolerans]|uniref:ArsR/SmtB family transcription factor n=1 Tax=Paenibacillus alkalitolerans TaxID=2799335 RepID=UPI0018F71F5E|nr:metalloregulator ArsR/SmtB family transcription factor [Paenibacillus alkalitolerans]
MDQDTCEIFCYDEAKVNRLKKQLWDDSTEYMAKIFKALADDTRAKIAYSLCLEEELCVCDVANVIGTTVANVSHHLRLLKNLGLAKYRKSGKLVFYSLDDEHVKQLILLAMEHGSEGKHAEAAHDE